jgi:hypothetical protein
MVVIGRGQAVATTSERMAIKRPWNALPSKGLPQTRPGEEDARTLCTRLHQQA